MAGYKRLRTAAEVADDLLGKARRQVPFFWVNVVLMDPCTKFSLLPDTIVEGIIVMTMTLAVLRTTVGSFPLHQCIEGSVPAARP